MRMIDPETENVLYDHNAKEKGRGIYICPTAECLEKMGKNRKFKFNPSKKEIEAFKWNICSVISEEIMKQITLCIKMGYMQKSAEVTISSGDFLIEGRKSESSRKLVEKAEKQGIKIFNLQACCGEVFPDTAIVKETWPMQKKLLRNLERFQSLSFRGVFV